jgi:N-acetylmuramoyl-L-alanine amidase
MISRSWAERVTLCLVACILFATPAFARKKAKATSNNSPAASRASIVVIDPGHGGLDRGGIPGQRVAEKNVALDVALRLKRKLQAAGYRVIMTRDSDVFVPLSWRVAVANSHRDAIFICIHFNSARRLGANGVETYYYRWDSARLASNIHKNVIAGAPSENRGIRRRGYYVLRRTSIPGVLVECGFLTNPSEARLAQTIAYRDKLAEEITRGIMGKPPLVVRAPASRHYPPATEVERQPFNAYMGTDFVRVPAERTTRSRKSSRRSKSARKKKSSRTKKKTTSTKKSEELIGLTGFDGRGNARGGKRRI